jgi:hypothetical protein
MSGYIPANLRRLVRTRAQGRCEYCLIHENYRDQPHEVDHIIAEKHRGKTEPANLCLCCAVCNRYMGADLASVDPETEEMTFLFHPRRDAWAMHFVTENGRIDGITAKGRATVALLHFNDPLLVRARRLLLQSGLYP